MSHHPHHTDPNEAPGIKRPLKYKTCQSCRVHLPVSAYTLNRLGRGGFGHECTDCKKQNLRLYRQKRYGSTSKVDDSLIRSVSLHNQLILGPVLAQNKAEFRAFDVVSKMEYHVYYGPSERLGLNSLTLFTKDGSVFMEWALSGVKEPVQFLLAYLRLHNLRLELDDMGVINAKSAIYFL